MDNENLTQYKKGMGPGCNNCSLNCTQKVSLLQRKEIFDKFWSLKKDEQRNFIAYFIHYEEPRKREECRVRERDTIYMYTFEVSSNVVQICQTMFLDTLGISEKKLRNILMEISNAETLYSMKSDDHKENEVSIAIQDSLTEDILRNKPKIAEQYEFNIKNISKSEKKLGPGCNDCRLKCSKNIQLYQRKEIFDKFWSLTKDEQINFIDHLISSTKPQKRRKESKGDRNVTNTYTLEVSSNIVKVCRTMFIDTLGISGKKLRNFLIKISKLNKLCNIRSDDQDETESENEVSIVIDRSFIEYLPEFIDKKIKKEIKKVNTQIIPKFKNKMGQGCSNCRLKCSTKVQLNQRKEIFDKFWSLKKGEQMHFIAQSIIFKEPENRKENREKERKVTYVYTFKIFTNIVKVCRTMFVHTLGLTEKKLRIILFKIWKMRSFNIPKPDNHEENESENEVSMVIDERFIDDVPQYDEICQKKQRTSEESELASEEILQFYNKMRPGCSNCRLNCSKKVQLYQRKEIYDKFWTLKKDEQIHFIDHLIISKEPQKRKKCRERDRSITYTYTLEVSSSIIKVCRTMFIDTLGISEAKLRNILHKISNTKTLDNAKSDDDENESENEVSLVIEENFIEDLPQILQSQGTKRKKRKISEESKLESKNILNHKKELGPGCFNCRLNCLEKVPLNQRKEIFDKFWSLKKNEQIHFIAHLLIFKEPQKRKKDSEGGRNKTNTYTLKISSNIIKVCQTMFVHTLGISEKKLRNVLLKISNMEMFNNTKDNYQDEEYNGKRLSEIRENVIKHIMSYKLVKSQHYQTETDKRFIQGVSSVTSMYKDYKNKMLKEKMNICSRQYYKHILNTEFDIEFHIPGRDLCDICTSFKNLSNEEQMSQRNDFMLHIKNVQLVRDAMEQDKKDAQNNSTLCVACFGMQQTLFTPQTNASNNKRKLHIYNLTVCNLATNEGACFIWNETEGSKGINAISSSLWLYLHTMYEFGIKEFRFYTDNCSTQNKNKILFSMYKRACEKLKITIIHKYLEKGHTYNKNDLMHERIENSCKNMEIYTQNQWVEVLLNANVEGPKYTVYEMTTKNILNFNSLAENQDWREIKVLQVKEIKFKFPLTYIFIKYDHTHECEPFQVDTEISLSKMWPLVPVNNKKILLDNEKKENLQLMLNSKSIPLKFHDFYEKILS